jgi:hypothetical protein
VAPSVRIVLLVAVGVAAFLPGEALAGKPNIPSETAAGPLTVTSVKSVFIPTELATKYTVDYTDVSKGSEGSDAWTLVLTLVDPAGSSPPGLPNSHAAVDDTCDNSKLPGGDTLTLNDGAKIHSIGVWLRIGESFTWFHGDKGSYLPSAYGCDHTKMGPSGHQGIVVFAVTSKDGKWQCRAQASGTNLGVTPEYGLKPTCSNTAHDTYVLYADLVETHIAEERAAAAEIGSNNKEAVHQLGNAYSGMRDAASIVKSKGGDAGTVGDMTGASDLDADAEKQDLTTAAGRKKALDDIAAAIKLKKKAIAGLTALAAAQPLD